MTAETSTSPTEPVDPAVRARVRALLADHPVWDGHNDLPWAARKLVAYDLDGRGAHGSSGGSSGGLDLAAGTGDRTHTDLPRLRAGGVGAQFWSVYVPAQLSGTRGTGGTAVTATLEQIDFVKNLVARFPDDLALALTADDVEAAWASGRIASLMGAEGGHSIDCSLGALRSLYELGVRYMTLTHNDNVPWADSATDAPSDHGGLSAFGREVVREMNRLGMLVDLSHVSAGTMRAALDITEAPVIFSHSSARAVCDVPRDVPDDVLSRLPENGGVCMVTFVPKFVTPAVAEWNTEAASAAAREGVASTDVGRFQEFLAGWVPEHPSPATTLSDVVAHVEHVREVAGIDHVGLGGDYDGASGFAPGLEDVSGYPNLLVALAERGWSDEDLGKLASGNVLRVLREAEEVARRVAAERGPSVRTFADLDGSPSSAPE
ncbi:dipeptidase [Paraoerskovia sediminicola]|uniref:Dipeptidase n=1 Tax=Paraoerskovia sediminicola TaxID=1138587 RepID=A0ABN6XAL5_9CELL|nr:dipeptidase [Paraoerskovia sediminicola]BDZ41977.1 dipeptidase [Paraoerskovia sediminicola]